MRIRKSHLPSGWMRGTTVSGVSDDPGPASHGTGRRVGLRAHHLNHSRPPHPYRRMVGVAKFLADANTRKDPFHAKVISAGTILAEESGVVGP